MCVNSVCPDTHIPGEEPVILRGDLVTFRHRIAVGSFDDYYLLNTDVKVNFD
jgi:hypothetical protein